MNRYNIIQEIQKKYIHYNKLDSDIKNRLQAINCNDEFFFENLQNILYEFYDSHTKITTLKDRQYYLPLGLKIINNHIVVIDNYNTVNNIQPGFVLKQINGKSISKYMTEFNNIEGTTVLKLMRLLEIITYSHNEREISLSFDDNRNNTYTVPVSYISLPQKLYNKKEMSQSLALYENAISEQYNISYVKCPSLLDEEGIKETITKLKNLNSTDILLFDIRDNLGGRIELAKALTSLFLSANQNYYVKSRTKNFKIEIPASLDRIQCQKIGILFNCCTCSCLEFIFLRSLQRNNNIFYFGEPTAGMKDIATVYTLDEHLLFSLSTKIYIEKDGKPICEKRIFPQYPIIPDIHYFLNGKDLQLKKTIEKLKNVDVMSQTTL